MPRAAVPACATRCSDPLLILMAVAAGVLLIVSANVANLLIARGAARHRELALRLAVGASRRQIVRLLLVESLVLAVAGALLGVLVASWSAGMLLGYFVTPESPIAVTADADARIMSFTASLAMLTALVAGHRSGVPQHRHGHRADAEERRRRRRQRTANAAQDAGRRAGRIVVPAPDWRGPLPPQPGESACRRSGIPDEPRCSALASTWNETAIRASAAGHLRRTVHDALRSTPGVVSASYAFFGMLEGGGWGMGFTVEGYQPPAGDSAGAMCNGVSPGFFKEMGVPLVAGREFDARDDAVQPPPEGWPYRVAVVNQTFVKRYFKGGQRAGTPHRDW